MHRCIVFLMSILLPSIIYSQIQISQEFAPIELVKAENVKTLYATTHDSFEDIRSKAFEKGFTRIDSRSDKTVLWLKFELLNIDTNYSDYYFYSIEGAFSVYQQTDTGWFVQKNGFLLPLADRANPDNARFIKINLPPNQSTEIFLCFRPGAFSKGRYSARIGGEKYYYKRLIADEKFSLPSHTFSLMYLSGLIIIFFFVFILFLSVQNRVYLYYLLYLAFQIVYALIVFSHNPMVDWEFTNAHPAIGYRIMEGIQFTFIGFYIFFIIELIEVKKFDQILAQTMMGFGWFCFAYAIINPTVVQFFPDSHLHFQVFKYVRYVVLPFNLILILWVIWKVKHPLVGYFIVGNIFFFSGAIISVFMSITRAGVGPGQLFYFDDSMNTVFQMGLLCEVFCFSFAIAHHVKLIYNEKKENSVALIRQLEENQRIQENMNKELDKKVQQKTSELIEVYSAIEKQREKEITSTFSQKLKESEMLVLRSQMNPHFLFNSMNAIKHLILMERSKDAMDYLDDFASLLRGVLQNSKRETITVEDELELLELYLSLERGRLGSSLNYQIVAADRTELSQYPIPALLLQPFVENAIWHGLQPKTNEQKNLEIIFDTTDNLIITIRDNGIGRKAARALNGKKSLHKSLGIQITRERLSLFNHLNEFKIDLNITDLKEDGIPKGTLIKFTYSI